MAVTKTNFINYTRCPRYIALENIKQEKLTSNMTLSEYKKEEQAEEIKDILDSLFEETEDGDIDLTKKVDKQLEAMMGYYKEVELEAARVVQEIFGGTTIFSSNTYNQESFDFSLNGINYLCYVDIYNEQEDCINIIEVKATTSNKYKNIEYGKQKEEKFPLFIKKGDINILSPCVLQNDAKVVKSYESKVNRLKNRYTDEGKYIYDLAVQRYIIENDFKQHNINKKVNYYLAVLNADYIYDGYQENNVRIYRKIDDQDIITIYELNDLTFDMQPIIDNERKHLENYIYNPSNNSCELGVYCALKKRTECIYKEICFKNVPHYNASYNYIGFRGFKDLEGQNYNKYDLINNGYYKLNDVPYEWLTNPNHIIQRNCFDKDEVYFNKEKIEAFLNQIEYPIYHLDFETFPCPMPRFFGEKPYTQSVFEFSLHVEHSPGICNKIEDNYVYLASTSEDERKQIAKALVDHIDPSKGTMLAQNVSFEKGRLKELAELYPEYRDKLLGIRAIGFDLLYVIKNNEKMAKELGFDDQSKLINYYNNNQSGSYSIKKTLPLFTNLKYSDLEIQNGTEALVEYSKYNTFTKEKLHDTRMNLIEYCRQDTWAMVEILRGLRELVK